LTFTKINNKKEYKYKMSWRIIYLIIFIALLCIIGVSTLIIQHFSTDKGTVILYVYQSGSNEPSIKVYDSDNAEARKNQLADVSNVSKIMVHLGYNLLMFTEKNQTPEVYTNVLYGKGQGDNANTNYKTIDKSEKYNQGQQGGDDAKPINPKTLADFKSFNVVNTSIISTLTIAGAQAAKPRGPRYLEHRIVEGEVHAHSTSSSKTYDVPWWTDDSKMVNDAAVRYTLVTGIKIQTVCPRWRNILQFGQIDDQWGPRNGTWTTDRSPGIWTVPYHRTRDDSYKTTSNPSRIHYRQSSFHEGNSGLDIECPTGESFFLTAVVDDEILTVRIYDQNYNEYRSETLSMKALNSRFRWGHSGGKKMHLNIAHLRHHDEGKKIMDKFDFPGVILKDLYFTDEVLTVDQIKQLCETIGKVTDEKLQEFGLVFDARYGMNSVTKSKSISIQNKEGKTSTLNGMRADCPGGVINQVKLNSDTNDQYMYDFTCADAQFEKGKDDVYYFARSTPVNDYGDGQAIYLDRHFMECDVLNASLKLFDMKMPTDGLIKYDYVCQANKVPMKCEGKSTGFSDAGQEEYFDIEHLKKHDIKCGENEGIGSIHLSRDPSGKQYQYNYTCCKPS
jgi:hypothetical protein